MTIPLLTGPQNPADIKSIANYVIANVNASSATISSSSQAAIDAAAQAQLYAQAAAASVSLTSMLFYDVDGGTGLLIVSADGYEEFDSYEIDASVTSIEGSSRNLATLQFYDVDGGEGLLIVSSDGYLMGESVASVLATATDVSSTVDPTTDVSVPLIDATRIAIWLFVGQSLDVEGGSGFTQTSLFPVAAHPTNVLMPSTGLHDEGVTWSSLVAAVSQADSVGQIANGPIGFMNRLYERLLALTGVATTHAGIVIGDSGQRIEALMRGGMYDSIMMAAVERAVAWAGNNGFTGGAYVAGIEFIQGNADGSILSAREYQNRMSQFRALAEPSLMALTGQKEPIVMYIRQAMFAQTGYATDDPIVNAQTQVYFDDRMIRPTGPSYSEDSSDGTHDDNKNYVFSRERAAEWILIDHYGLGYRPFCVDLTRIERTAATTWDLPIYVPVPPLLKLTDNVLINSLGLDWGHGANGYGFEFDDGSHVAGIYVSAVDITDTGVSPDDERRAIVRVTLSAEPTAKSTWRLYIGQREAVSLAVTGAVNNGSGKVRLTTAAHNLITGATVGVALVGGVAAISGATQVITTITVIDTTHVDLTTVTFAGGDSYTSGGTLYPKRGRTAGGRTCFADSSTALSSLKWDGSVASGDGKPIPNFLMRQTVQLPK